MTAEDKNTLQTITNIIGLTLRGFKEENSKLIKITLSGIALRKDFIEQNLCNEFLFKISEYVLIFETNKERNLEILFVIKALDFISVENNFKSIFSFNDYILQKQISEMNISELEKTVELNFIKSIFAGNNFYLFNSNNGKIDQGFLYDLLLYDLRGKTALMHFNSIVLPKGISNFFPKNVENKQNYLINVARLDFSTNEYKYFKKNVLKKVDNAKTTWNFFMTIKDYLFIFYAKGLHAIVIYA